MIIERSKNAVRNTVYGLVNRIISIVAPFIVRTVFIYTLSIEYLGLNSLFSSVLSVLSLAELGFGTAIVFSMYKPIAEDDSEAINALLYFYRKVYRIIGSTILIIGLCLIPFIPFLINGEYPSDINITVVYLIYLLNTVISYFMFGYMGAIISAHQREDLLSKVSIAINLTMYLLQIVVLLLLKEYYIYLLILPLFTIINNLRTFFVAKKFYPQYKPVGRIDADMKHMIREKIGGLVIGKLTDVTRNSFDSIFISLYLGLTETAIYNNYYFILNAVSSLLIIIPTAINAGAGNSVVTDSINKNYRDMNRINFLYMWIAGWCSISLLCLFQPFMKIWVGEELLFPFHIVLLICLYFYVLKMGDIRSVYVGASGIWWQVRYRAITETIVNIVLNWMLGKYFGILGIIIATLISLFLINFVWGSRLIFKYYFTGIKSRYYYLNHAKYFAVTCIIAIITLYICSLIPDAGIGYFLIKGLICLIIPNSLYLLIYMRITYCKEALKWVCSIVKNTKPC